VQSSFSALQRAEIAEIEHVYPLVEEMISVSVLFNEPKLLKSIDFVDGFGVSKSFSALQRAEIAEIL